MKTYKEFMTEERSNAATKTILLALEPKGSAIWLFDNGTVKIVDKDNRDRKTRLVKVNDVINLEKDGYIKETKPQVYVLTPKGQKHVDLFV